MILAGDIGGTKTILALFEKSETGLVRRGEAIFASRDFESFQDVMGSFLDVHQAPNLQAACIGVAGVVSEGKAETTNLPWSLDETTLSELTGAQCVKLINDLQATAYGMLELSSSERASLNPDSTPARPGNIAVLAAGTGLGQAILYWDGERHHAIASEGGHVGFAPRNNQEMALLAYLQEQFGSHVSYERILSGPGVHNLYRFLRDRGFAEEDPAVATRLAQGDPGVVITDLALQGSDSLSVQTLRLFCSIYGAEAGNLALKCVSLGGVFIGGGIAPKILSILGSGEFLRAFLDKGRFRGLMETLEISVSLNPQAALLGAASHASRL